MKVVFVNALNNNANVQQNGQKTQQITINNKSLAQLQQQHNNAFLTKQLISTSQGQKVQIVQSSHLNSVPKVTTTVTNGESSSKGSKLGLGTKLPGRFDKLSRIYLKLTMEIYFSHKKPAHKYHRDREPTS